jgi:hypothetical protein
VKRENARALFPSLLVQQLVVTIESLEAKRDNRRTVEQLRASDDEVG